MFEEEEDVEDDEGWDEEGDGWQQQLPLFSRWVKKSLLFACRLVDYFFLVCFVGSETCFFCFLFISLALCNCLCCSKPAALSFLL